MVTQSPPAAPPPAQPRPASPRPDDHITGAPGSGMVQLRLISMGLAAIICAGIVYVAVTGKFSAVSDIFKDVTAIKAEVELEEPPPPPPPPPDRPPPPPPPMMSPPNPNVEAPPTPTPLPVTLDPPPPPAPAAPPAPAVITNPRWIERPSGQDFADLYPRRAAQAEREGRVVLDCVVAANGRISCTVASEEPEGWGFGEASLRASRRFRIAPQLEDGRPSEGGRLRVPMRWQLGN